MENVAYIGPMVGGALIGLSASLLLLFNGRIFGISGILGGALNPKTHDTLWRYVVLVGLVLSGFIVLRFLPEQLSIPETQPNWVYILAGLLVGFGTQLGNGCTSGHGVCGMSRLSSRSLVATLTFIASGMTIVFLMRKMGMMP